MTPDPWLVEDHRGDAGPMLTPPRRAQSIRRTTSVEMAYPQGPQGPVTLHCHGRDVLTLDPAAAPQLLAEDWMDVRVSHDGLLQALTSQPPCPESAQWLGQSTLRGFRKAIQPVRDDPARGSRPIVQLLDDLVGCAVIAHWVDTRWVPIPVVASEQAAKYRQQLEGVCVSYAPGAKSLEEEGYLRRLYLIPPLQRPDDPHAFHPLQPDTDRTQRRVRRIDIWREAPDVLAIDAMFQDSGVAPGTRRVAVHEYRLQARAVGPDHRLDSVTTASGHLPHTLCTTAPQGLQKLLGLPLANLAREVLLRLPGTAGCTHLNDAMRALAAVPGLVGRL